jgi:HK97 family phage prohead protease
MTQDAARTGLDRMLAAQARAEALGGAAERGQAPREVGAARVVPCAAQQLRATLVERGGKQLYHLSGVASVTDKPYRMWDLFGEYDEIVERGAFTDTLAADPDVAFLVNHRGVTMARTTNGTLELGMVDEGLGMDAWLNPQRQDVKDLMVAIEDGAITEMSFAFMLEKGWWSDDFTEFRISKLDIDRGDVSAVNYGANPYTSIAARSRELLAELDRLPAGAARAAMARLSARDDMRSTGPAPSEPPATTPVTPSGGSVDLYEAMLEVC